MSEQDASADWQLGYYSVDCSGNNASSNTELPIFSSWAMSCHYLRSLALSDTQGINCIVVDIRYDAELVLSHCRDISSKIPLIALVHADQFFDDAYPYGAYVSDVTTIEECGSSVFRQRVKQAIEHYRTPISTRDVRNPVYGVFQTIANQASEWILLKDLDHRFVLAGEPFANMTGVPVSEMIGRDDLEVGDVERAVIGDPSTGQRGFWNRDDDVTSSGVSTVEYNPDWRQYSSEARHRRTYRVALKNPADEIYGLLVCSRDVTEQVKNSQLLSERTLMLKQVTAEKKRADLNRQIAEKAMEEKTLFMAAASHDLRQPLHAIGLFLDRLDKRVAGTEEKLLVNQIKQSCTSLSSLVASCLDVSKLDAGGVERHMSHLAAASFLSKFTEEFSFLAAEKSLEYRLIVDDSILYSDQDLLSRIVRNLFVNALQNTQSGFITIKCQQQGAKVRLSVLDSGCGIAADELERVFLEFHQVEFAGSRQERGFGLGLSIVKRLSDLLDIGVELESEPEKGSCFILTIPGGQLGNVQCEPLEESSNLLQGLCVLIIENDQRVLHSMEVFLESHDCQILSAHGLQSAITLLDDCSSLPDIIVADFHLAGDSRGINVIQACRKKMGAQVPALLVTGDTSSDISRDAASYQLPVLYKPVDTDELLAKISKEVSTSRVALRSRGVFETSVLT